jgi:hypothetical protein
MAAPTITFREFDVAVNSDPSGWRHLKTGDADVHEAFTKSLGTAVGEHLDFGINNISNSGINSATKVVLAHMDASGDLTTQLYNLKFWLTSVSSFTGTDRYNFQKSNYVEQSGWKPDLVVQNSSLEQVPTVLPTSGNILRQDGSGLITGSGDAEVTEWLYLSVFTDTNEPVGLKGGPGLNTFRYRLTADYY